MTKLNVLIMCMQGMSTSVIENKMSQSAAQRGIDLKINAIATHQFKEFGVGESDIVVLGPQVKYMESDIRKKMNAQGAENIPLYVIEAQDFGMMRGDAVLTKILKILHKA